MTKRVLPIALIFAVAFSAWGAQPAAETTTITVWGWVYAVDCLKANLSEFSHAYPEIKVVFKVLAPADIYLRLPPALTNGIGLPDVVVLEDSHVAPMAVTGGLLDLTSRVAPYRAKFNAYKWTAVSSGGRVYAMPWDSAPVVLFYRRDLFAAAGLPSSPGEVAPLLATWEDYYRTMKIIKEKTGAYALPLSGPRNDGRLFEILLQQQGGGYFDERGRLILDDPRALKSLEFLGRLYKEGLTHESVPWEDPWYAAIREGKVATLIGGAYLESFLRNWIAPDAVGLWGMVPLPRWARNEGARTAGDGGTSLAIPKR
ncbi:MAG: extracellular solute-binding protein, partial [Firmicutes bacterium]|nr:extracellular solute-binding protein [Bacillota bacterium]